MKGFDIMLSYNCLIVVYGFLTVFGFLCYLLRHWLDKAMMKQREEERKMKNDRNMWDNVSSIS